MPRALGFRVQGEELMVKECSFEASSSLKSQPATVPFEASPASKPQALHLSPSSVGPQFPLLPASFPPQKKGGLGGHSKDARRQGLLHLLACGLGDADLHGLGELER